MTYKLFLDDLREIKDIYPNAGPDEWVLARTYDEALNCILVHGVPTELSFDNDISDEQEPERTGYTLAKQLVELDMDGIISIPSNFTWWVHSANCLAWANIDLYLSNYLTQKENHEST